MRYERDQPGDLVHMDVKKIGRIPDGGGWRAHGLNMGSTAAKKARIGFDYVHSVVDNHSRGRVQLACEHAGTRVGPWRRRAFRIVVIGYSRQAPLRCAPHAQAVEYCTDQL